MIIIYLCMLIDYILHFNYFNNIVWWELNTGIFISSRDISIPQGLC